MSKELKRMYDWVIFDYGGTLTLGVRATPKTDPELTDIYGKILGEWFGRMNYKVDKTDAELQKLTELAHQNTDGSPSPESLLVTIEYYTKWMAWIYANAGVPGHITRCELEMARLYMTGRVAELKAGEPTPELLDMLDTLKNNGIKLAVISNNSGYVEDAVCRLGIRDYFEFVIDSSRVGVCKPDRKIFDIAVEQNGLGGKRLLYVGDNYVADAEGSVNAGWDAAWISEDDPPEQNERVYCIKTLSELKDICLVQC